MARSVSAFLVPMLSVMVASLGHASGDVNSYNSCLAQARQVKIEQLKQACLEARSPDDCMSSPAVTSSDLDSLTISTCRQQAGIDDVSPVGAAHPTDKVPTGGRLVIPAPGVAAPVGTGVPPPVIRPKVIDTRPAPAKTSTGADPPLPPRRPKNLSADKSGAPANPSADATKSTNPDGSASGDPAANSSTSDAANSADLSQSSSESARAQADTDVSLCSDLYSSAVRCCGNPLSCASSSDQAQINQANASAKAGPAPGQGITDYCNQLKTASDNSGQANGILGGVCATNQGSCHSTCAGLAQKYSDLIYNCNGCANSSIYESAYSALLDRGGACSGLRVRADAISRQALSSADSGGYSSVCKNLASSDPASGGLPGAPGGASGAATAQKDDPHGCSANPNSDACAKCTDNPGSVACRTLAASNQSVRGNAGFADAKKPAAGDSFNVGDGDALARAAQAYQTQFTAPVQTQARPIANNSGGAIPGQAGGLATASLGGDSHGAKPGTNMKSDGSGFADILQGERSGGYSRTVANANENGDAFSWRRPRNGASSTLGTGANLFGMNLRQFLPGGSRDPNGRLAGLGSGQNQINGKAEDIFRLITNKMIEKCKLGILWECTP